MLAFTQAFGSTCGEIRCRRNLVKNWRYGGSGVPPNPSSESGIGDALIVGPTRWGEGGLDGFLFDASAVTSSTEGRGVAAEAPDTNDRVIPVGSTDDSLVTGILGLDPVLPYSLDTPESSLVLVADWARVAEWTLLMAKSANRAATRGDFMSLKGR